MKKLVMAIPAGLLAVVLVGAGMQLGARRAKQAAQSATTPADGERGAEMDRMAWENRGLRARIEHLEARLAWASCDNGGPGALEPPTNAGVAPEAAPVAEPAPAAPVEHAAEAALLPEAATGADPVAARWAAEAEARLIDLWVRLQAEGPTRGPGQVSCDQDQCRVQIEPGGELPVAERVQRILTEVSAFLPYSVVEPNAEGPTTIVFRRRPG